MMWLAALSSDLLHFDMAAQYFEEILLKKRNRKELIKHIECSNVLVECELLAGVNVNVCGAAEAPKEQAGK